MVVLNKIDRFHLAIDVIEKLNISNKEELKNIFNDKLEKHSKYIKENGLDMPEIINWSWNEKAINISTTEDDNK